MEKLLQVIDPETGEVIHEFLAHKGRRMDKDGSEMPDPTPMAPPVGYVKQPSMWDIQREAIRAAKLELARELAEEAGFESPEEADDFDVDDDPEIQTRYQIDETESVMEHRRRMTEAEDSARRSAASADDGSAEGAKPKRAKPSSAKPQPGLESDDAED